jgi:uncharacterized membrane protein YeaQ/YmgE (transglycosylase-associated protein family)
MPLFVERGELMKKQMMKTVNAIALGSVGIMVSSAITGCAPQQQEQQMGNKFLVIQEDANGKYTVVEEHPTEGPTRAIIRDKEGNERFMNEAELKALAEQEYQKVEDGTSETVSAPSGDAGMGLAGTILAAAAGALLGNMIANKLMNNSNFQQRSTMNNKSAYSRSTSPTKSSTSTSSKKSYFGGSSSGSTTRSSTSSYGG